jgi:hypothetical protein
MRLIRIGIAINEVAGRRPTAPAIVDQVDELSEAIDEKQFYQ